MGRGRSFNVPVNPDRVGAKEQRRVQLMSEKKYIKTLPLADRQAIAYMDKFVVDVLEGLGKGYSLSSRPYYETLKEMIIDDYTRNT